MVPKVSESEESAVLRESDDSALLRKVAILVILDVLARFRLSQKPDSGRRRPALSCQNRQESSLSVTFAAFAIPPLCEILSLLLTF